MTDAAMFTSAAAIVLVGLFGATTGWTRHANPRLAARALVAMSSVVALAMVATLVMLALPLVGRSDQLADRAHWSEAVFARGSVSSLAVSWLAAITVAAGVLRVVLELRVQIRDKVAAKRFRDEVGAAYGETVIAALDAVEAMTLASGVIVITEGLVRALDAEERRAVLAHERAHAHHRHHLYRQTAALLAAVNPLLHRVPETVAYLTERWADEEAARSTSRATVATALEHVARLSGAHRDHSIATMHAAAAGVPDRLLALQSTPRKLSWYRLIPQAALVSCVVAVALAAIERTLDLFQLAHAL